MSMPLVPQSALVSRRLSRDNLRDLPRDARRPLYDWTAVTPGIVHLGVGAFHRAHQAVYVEDALQAGDLAWGIVAASLRSPRGHIRSTSTRAPSSGEGSS